MELPFTVEQFFETFQRYNDAVWPAPMAAYVLGGLAVALALWRRTTSDRTIGFILAGMWIWIGAVYHSLFFAEINPAAILFGALFVIQGLLFVYVAFNAPSLRFAFRRDAYGVAGALLIAYATIVYPLLGAALGHVYPHAPVFGVAPCPTTIFTFGLLLWTTARVRLWLLVIPVLWSLVGTGAALSLGVPEDFGLLAAAVVGTSMLVYRNRHDVRRLAAA